MKHISEIIPVFIDNLIKKANGEIAEDETVRGEK